MKDDIKNFKPWKHKHNDTSEFSKKSSRRHPSDVGRLCKDVFNEKQTEEIKKINFDFQFGGYKQRNNIQESSVQKILKKK